MCALTCTPSHSISASRTNTTVLAAQPRPAVRAGAVGAGSGEASGWVSEGKKQEAPLAQVPGGQGWAVRAGRGEGRGALPTPTHAAGWDCVALLQRPPPPPEGATLLQPAFRSLAAALTGLPETWAVRKRNVGAWSPGRARVRLGGPPQPFRRHCTFSLFSFSLPLWKCCEQILPFLSVDHSDFLAFTICSAFLLGLGLNLYPEQGRVSGSRCKRPS